MSVQPYVFFKITQYYVQYIMVCWNGCVCLGRFVCVGLYECMNYTVCLDMHNYYFLLHFMYCMHECINVLESMFV